jgi:tryptophan-rich sensory protein
MEFNLLALLIAIGCTLIAIIVAGISANNKKDKEWLDNLKHPDNAFLFKVLNKFGLIVFLMFGFVLYIFLAKGDIVPIIITVITIQFYGLSPLFMNKTKNLKLFFISGLIITVFIVAMIFFLIQINVIFAIIVSIYLLWLIYEHSYFFRLMNLNK